MKFTMRKSGQRLATIRVEDRDTLLAIMGAVVLAHDHGQANS